MQLAMLATFLAARAALAWEPASAAEVERRLAGTSTAPAQVAPEWTRRTSWTLVDGGRTYVFGVGLAAATLPAGLRQELADAAARAAIVKQDGTHVAIERIAETKRVDAKAAGTVSAAVLDRWSGTAGLYALVVAVR